MANEQDYIELGLSCADVCKALDLGLKERRVDELNESMLWAIEKLTTSVEPTIRSLNDSLTKAQIAELWQGSKRRSSSRVNETGSRAASTRRAIKTQSPLGNKTFTASSLYSTWVWLIPSGDL